MTPIQKATLILIINYIKHLKQGQKMEKKIKIHNATAQPREEEAKRLIEILDIPGTPFKAIKDENQNAWFIVWGPYKISRNQDTYNECLKHLETNLWDVIGTYTIAIMQEYEKNIKRELEQPMSVHENADMGAF